MEGGMARQITLGTTRFQELGKILGYEDDIFEQKKARLFPLGNTLDEIHTTSIFLSTLSAVKEYREYLLSEIGVNKIKNRNVNLHVFTEISRNTKNGNSSADRPDGLIVLTSGKRDPVIDWISFVESKVNKNTIDYTQLKRYIDFGKEVGIKSIITISNNLTTSPFDTPVRDFKKPKGFELYHWSWTYLKVMSTRLLRMNAIQDEDHEYILKELRRYLDEHKNITNFIDMGKNWYESIQHIYESDSKKRPNYEYINNIINSYVQEEKDIALQLTDNTDYYVQLKIKNRENRLESLRSQLEEERCLISEYFVNGEKSNTFKLTIDVTRKSIACECDVVIDAGKAKRQTTLLLNMLSPAAESNILIKAIYPRNKSADAQPLGKLSKEKEDNEFYSILDKSLGDSVKMFRISLKKEIGRDMNNRKKFVENVENLCDTFLRQVIRYTFLGEK